MLHLREALIQTGWGDLIGGCEGLHIAANPPKEAIKALRRQDNRAVGGDDERYHTLSNPAKG
jgi:hypothetical protein